MKPRYHMDDFIYR